MQTDESLRQSVGGDMKGNGELKSLYSFISLYQCTINEYNELHTLVKQIEVLRQKIMAEISETKSESKNYVRQKQALRCTVPTKRNENKDNGINGVLIHSKRVPAHFVNKTPKLKRHKDVESSNTIPVLSKSQPNQISVSFKYELTISRLLGDLNVKNIHVSSLICIQKHRLLKELLEIFHVKLEESFPTLKGFSIFSLNEYLSRINTIKPADLWIIGTSLGFLAHFTKLFAKYLDLPLSGKFIIHSSMSYIVRNDSTAQLHCSEFTNQFPSHNTNECVISQHFKETYHNENISNNVLKQSDFGTPSPALCEEKDLHDTSKSFIRENWLTNMTLYSRSSSLRRIHSTASNTDATQLYLVNENKTSFETLPKPLLNNSVCDSLETIKLVQWPTTDLILSSLPESTTTKLKSTLSFFSLRKKNTTLSLSLPSSLFNWACLPLFLRTTQEADKLLLAEGLLAFESTIRQLCSLYESKNGCNLLNPLQENFIKNYPIKSSTNFLKMLSAQYTKETQSLFDPFRRMIAYELLYKSVKQ